MSRLFLLLLAGMFCSLKVCAQDIILLRDAREIKADVIEVDELRIGYRDYGSSTGPVRYIGKSEIISITYRDGEKELYTSSAAAPADTAYPYPAVSRSYAVGDLFSEGDVRGVVVRVDGSGRHGLIISLQGATLEYGDAGFEAGENFVSAVVGCSDFHDGWRNQCRMSRFLVETNVPWESFPAFAWCRSLGPGWYLPSIEELALLWDLVPEAAGRRNQGNMARMRHTLNEWFRAYDGDLIRAFSHGSFIWSSTEASAKGAFILIWENNTTRDLRTYGAFKVQKYNVRAFHRF